jgi:uncharacterized repeat protein (TIGR01451 family)
METFFMNGSEGTPLTLLSKSVLNTPQDTEPAYFDLFFTKGEGATAQCVPMRTELAGSQQDNNYYAINLSGSNSKVIVHAKSDVPATMNFYLAYATYGYPGIDTRSDEIIKTLSLTSTLTAYEIDFADWANRGKVNMFGIVINDPNVTVTIEKIEIGDKSWALYANHLKGRIYDDSNNDCLQQVGENGLSGIVMKADDGQNSFFGYTDSLGNYDIAVDSGSVTYAITPVFNELFQKNMTVSCNPGQVVVASGAGNVYCCADFATKVTHCSLLSIEVGSTRRRRCFTSTTYVSYINNGISSAEDAVVKVVYPEYLIPISSVPAWSSQIGDTLVYELSELTSGHSGSIVLIDSVICGDERIRGMSQCVTAIISPKSQCVSNEPAWDGSSVTVFPYCESGVARFEVKNVGQNMTGSSPFRLYSNDTLVFQSTFQLIAGNTFQVRYPANGAVIRLEADQRPSHPGRSIPRAFVEGCGTPAAQTSGTSESLILSVPQDDLDEDIAISCMTIVDSFDPNDKAAVPAGITDDHLVKAGEQLKYTIRFQNTGTDVAYKVKVVDTLDANLDVASFVEGAASHPYTLQFTNEGEKTIVTYLFDNINLKDSTTSEPESHGLLSFYIKSKADLADGNTIHNKADIFFDYNSAIVTNVVDHTIGTYVPTDLTKGNNVQVTTGLFEGHETSSSKVTLYPNPASDVIQVKLDQHISDGRLIILDLSGQEVFSSALKGEITSVSLSGLSTGMYLYKVMSKGEFVGVGKLLVK